jgi:hypothetical protein
VELWHLLQQPGEERVASIMQVWVLLLLPANLIDGGLTEISKSAHSGNKNRTALQMVTQLPNDNLAIITL